MMRVTEPPRTSCDSFSVSIFYTLYKCLIFFNNSKIIKLYHFAYFLTEFETNIWSNSENIQLLITNCKYTYDCLIVQDIIINTNKKGITQKASIVKFSYNLKKEVKPQVIKKYNKT